MNAWPEQSLAVVIGAGGMGMAVARRLGQHHRLLIADIDQSKLETQTARLQEDGIRADCIVCDVTSNASVQGLATRVGEIGNFSKLVHVAGLSPSMADWRTIMAVNLIGPTLVTNALYPLVSSGGVAVLISSLAAHLSTFEKVFLDALDNPLSPEFLDNVNAASGGSMTPQLAYMLSKTAVMRLCQKLAVTWGRKGARVVSVSPGLIATPQGANEFKRAVTKNELLNKCPLNRQGSIQEITDVIEYLASDRATYINGVDLLVDGGIRAAMREE